MRSTRLAAMAGLLAGAVSGPALAQHAHDEPREVGGLYYDLDLELQNDLTTRATDGNRRNNLKAEIEAALRYQATESMSFNLGLKLEQVNDPAAGEDEAFERHGAFVESLTVNYDSQGVGLYAGKFTPNFGVAWDVAPGIYTKEFAESDYELSERWGVGGSIGVPGGPFGHLDLSASAFFTDRTALSNSLFSRRGRTTKAAGGPSNTGDFSSFALALDGHEVPWFDTLEYQVAFVHQGKSQGNTADEQGVVASASFTWPLIGGVSLSPLLEYAVFNGREGVRDRDQQNLTGAARFDY